MADKVDEARELSKVIQQNVAGSFLSQRKTSWKAASEQAWKMSVGDAEI